MASYGPSKRVANPNLASPQLLARTDGRTYGLTDELPTTHKHLTFLIVREKTGRNAMSEFEMQVKSMIPADQFKLLNAAAAKKRTTVGAIVAEIVGKAVRPKVPGPAKPRGAIAYATTETIATFDRMYAEKRIDADIALATGMSHSWVAHHRKSLGLPRVGALGPMTRLERERLTPLAPTTTTAAMAAETSK